MNSEISGIPFIMFKTVFNLECYSSILLENNAEKSSDGTVYICVYLGKENGINLGNEKFFISKS